MSELPTLPRLPDRLPALPASLPRLPGRLPRLPSSIPSHLSKIEPDAYLARVFDLGLRAIHPDPRLAAFMQADEIVKNV